MMIKTRNTDIFAWALIALAAEPYVVSVLGTFSPILLEQLARNNGVLDSDHLTPCVTPPGEQPIPQPPHNFLQQNTEACVLPIFGGRLYIDTSSYALYTFSVAVLAQTVSVLTISGIADNSNYKKQLLVTFGVIGSLATMLFFLLNSENYYIASLLAIIANCSFGCVNVLMNSYLSILIKHFPNPIILEDEENAPKDSMELSKIGSRISGIGASTGYSAALLTQIASLTALSYLKDISTDVVWCIKTVIAAVGIWWFVWQFPIGLFLQNLDEPNKENSITLKNMIMKGYRDLIHALIKIKDLQDIFYYLLGWFVLSDSVTTINSTAILFAKTELHMSMVSLARIGVLVMISAITGSILIPHLIISKYKFNLQQVMVGLVLWCLVVPIYGIFALKKPSEMYLIAIWYGIGMGGLNTVSRSIYSIIIPSGKESVFFSIFSLTDKTSSIVGPFAVGLIINTLHEIRYAFWLLGALLLLSLPIISRFFNLERARQESNVFI